MNSDLIRTRKGLLSSHHFGYLCLCLAFVLLFQAFSFSVPLTPSFVSPQWLQALSSASVAVMANGDLGETIRSVRTQKRMGPFR